MKGTYQLLWLGPDTPRKRELTGTIAAGLEKLGLNANEDLALLSTSVSIDWRFPIVCVWAVEDRSTEATYLPHLHEAMRRGAPVLPILVSTKTYTTSVPEALLPINGVEWSNGMDRLASGILESFGIVRRNRSVFISYMRRHSSAVAHQLLHKLTDHGFRPFLDTASVEFGDQFQESLWDSLANVDFLVFIDTPGAITSTWVEQELTRAHNLGMATVHLRWPGWKGTPGTDLSSAFILESGDFLTSAPHAGSNGDPNPEGRLSDGILDNILKRCEQARMRSIGSRRTRIAGEIARQATGESLEAATDLAGGIVLSRKSVEKARLLPVVGFPDSPLLFQHLDSGGHALFTAMTYDNLGMRPKRADYLKWLNGGLKGFCSLPITEIRPWLKKL